MLPAVFFIKGDIPSRIVREHSVFMRLSAASNTSLCKLHKCLSNLSSTYFLTLVTLLPEVKENPTSAY